MLSSLVRQLKDPPIVEVVCGYFFAPLELDPLVVGKYWSECKERQGYSQHQIHPAVSDRLGLSFGEGMGPLRSWLITDNEEYVLQIQPDRFYFNWRKRKGEYPHFTDRGEREGVLTKSQREFAEFAEFCAKLFKQVPSPKHVELAKIDLLVSPKHWKDYADLTSLLPSLGKLPRIADEPTLSLSLSGPQRQFQVQFNLTNVVLAEDMSQAVRIETRINGLADSDIKQTMAAMNQLANDVFFGVLNESKLERFGGLINDDG